MAKVCFGKGIERAFGYDRTSWQCAVDDIVEYYFPTLVDVPLKVVFLTTAERNALKPNYYRANKNRWRGEYFPNEINIFTDHTTWNDFDDRDVEAVSTLLHELVHHLQEWEGRRYDQKHIEYSNRPIEIEARNFQEANKWDALKLVKEYLN